MPTPTRVDRGVVEDSLYGGPFIPIEPLKQVTVALGADLSTLRANFDQREEQRSDVSFLLSDGREVSTTAPLAEVLLTVELKTDYELYLFITNGNNLYVRTAIAITDEEPITLDQGCHAIVAPLTDLASQLGMNLERFLAETVADPDGEALSLLQSSGVESQQAPSKMEVWEATPREKRVLDPFTTPVEVLANYTLVASIVTYPEQWRTVEELEGKILCPRSNGIWAGECLSFIASTTISTNDGETIVVPRTLVPLRAGAEKGHGIEFVITDESHTFEPVVLGSIAAEDIQETVAVSIGVDSGPISSLEDLRILAAATPLVRIG